jgi:hypothetical protein
MEYPGAYYMVVLNDPQLRRTLVEGPRRTAARGAAGSTGWRLRVHIARCVHMLAEHVQPRAEHIPRVEDARGVREAWQSP